MTITLERRTTLQERLDIICDDRGIYHGRGKLRSLAQVMGLTPSRVSQLYSEGERAKVSADTLTALSKLGYNPRWVSLGEGPKIALDLGGASFPREVTIDYQGQPVTKSGRVESGNISAPPRPIVAVDDNSPLDDDEVEVPRLSLVLSAGSGRLNWEIDEKGTPNRFRKSWCKRKGLKPEKLVTVPVEGDSMAPTIPDGASVTINTADVSVRNGKPHAIDYMGEFYIKRLFRQPDQSILVRSDNPDKTRYPDWTITTEHGDALRIIGAPVAISADID